MSKLYGLLRDIGKEDYDDHNGMVLLVDGDQLMYSIDADWDELHLYITREHWRDWLVIGRLRAAHLSWFISNAVVVYDMDTRVTYLCLYMTHEHVLITRRQINVARSALLRAGELRANIGDEVAANDLDVAVMNDSYVVGLPIPIVDEINASSESEHNAMTAAINNTLHYLDQSGIALAHVLGGDYDVARVNEGLLIYKCDLPGSVNYIPTCDIVWLVDRLDSYELLPDIQLLYFEAMIQDGRNNWLVSGGQVTITDEDDRTMTATYTHGDQVDNLLRVDWDSDFSGPKVHALIETHEAELEHQRALLMDQYGYLAADARGLLLGDRVAVILPTD
jgi:hypothetical protein